MRYIDKFSQNKTARQTLFLFSSQIFGLLIGFISNMLLAKHMGANNFGLYSFAFAVISFIAIFFEFGYFASVARLLASTHDEQKEKKLIGSSLVIVAVISFIFLLAVFCVSLVIDSIFKDKVGYILRITSYVSMSYVIPFYMQLILKGSNHISILSLFQLVWKLIFITVIIILLYLNSLNPLYVLYALSVSCILSFVYFLFKLNPSFKNLKLYLSMIHKENISYGVHIYTGRISDVSASQIDKLLIGYFVEAKFVGLYSLANSMAMPINIFSSSLASSKFRSFADGTPISSKILNVNLVWIIFAIICANTLGYIIIKYYLGTEYHSMFLLLVLMSIAFGFQAAYQPYNAWLSSNGYGKEMKLLNFKMALFSLLLNLSLISVWGATGASIACTLSMAYTLFLFMKLYNLKKTTNIALTCN